MGCFRSGTTYQLNYLLFNSDSIPIEFFELSDRGTYIFDCEEKGWFIFKFDYPYIKGQLTLESDSLPTRVLDVSWDGFMGFRIMTDDLGIGFKNTMLLSN